MLHEDQLWPTKAMNAVYWCGQSTVVVFLSVFFSASFDKLQIGVLQAIPCICAIVAPPLWGALADMMRQQRQVHVFCLLTGALLMFSIQFASSSFPLACLLFFLAMFQTNPTASLLNQAILNLLKKVGGEYGKQRFFGAMGWGLGAFFTGLLVNAYGYAWAFNLHLAFLVPSLVVLSFIPPPDHPSEAIPSRESLLPGLVAVFQQPDVALLLLVALVMGLMYGAVSYFVTLNLFELSDGSNVIVGFAIWLETISELPAFFYADAIIKRLGIVRVLCISILGYAARITCYAFMKTPWIALPFEMLHGVTFSLMWTACTTYIYDVAQPGTHGTMMGLFSAIVSGIGQGSGTLVGGYFYEHYGAQVMWLVADMAVPIALVGLFFFSRAIPSSSAALSESKTVQIIDLRHIQPDTAAESKAYSSLKPSLPRSEHVVALKGTLELKGFHGVVQASVTARMTFEGVSIKSD
ncbi:hypothetical protein LEN26_007095 [Aphanomyces euteiches]|nr:hypothetical protein LEN26_007095 [Aphanomyces euteiches]